MNKNYECSAFEAEDWLDDENFDFESDDDFDFEDDEFYWEDDYEFPWDENGQSVEDWLEEVLG